MKKILIRSISGLVYVLLVVAAIYANVWLGEPNKSWICIVFFFAIGLIGTYEIIKNLKIKGKTINEPVAYAGAAITYLAISLLSEYEAGFSLLVLLLILPAVTMLLQLWRHDENPLETIAYSLLPSYWVMLPLGAINIIHEINIGMVMMIFILIWTNDTFAYLSGMLLGKHKMWERHSPGKTWEGTIGGLVFCIVAAMLVGPLLDTEKGTLLQLSILEWTAIGLSCSILGTLGDLVESMFKRYCGVKDSGNIMPGHGGMLDRFDSILMVTPFIAVIMMFL